MSTTPNPFRSVVKRIYFRYCLCSVHNCEGYSHIHLIALCTTPGTSLSFSLTKFEFFSPFHFITRPLPLGDQICARIFVYAGIPGPSPL